MFKNKKILYYIFLIIILIIIFYVTYYLLVKEKSDFYNILNHKNFKEDFEPMDYSNYKNIIQNGDFVNGKDASGYIDQSGSNEIIELINPSNSKYVLHQKDSNDLTYYEIMQPVLPNSSYLFSMWVKVDNPLVTPVNFSKLLRVRILKKNGSNEIPVINVTKDRETTINKEKWYLVNYLFNTSNDVKEHMNIYLSYDTRLIGSDIYYANLTLVKILRDINDFVFTNGLMLFISGLHTESGVLSLRDLGSIGNNMTLTNRATIDAKEGFINMYNNIAKKENASSIFNTSSIFMINLLTSINNSNIKVEDEEEDTNYSMSTPEGRTSSILSIRDANDKSIISLKVTKDNKIMLKCNDIIKFTNQSLILTNKTLLSIAFNNDLHKLIFYQDTVPILTIDNCPTLYFDKCTFVINRYQYLEMNLYDIMVHNYILLEKEHKELRTYLMNNQNRIPSNKPSIFDYIFPKNKSDIQDLSNNNNEDSTKDQFYRLFQSTSQIYSNVKKESCEKAEVKSTDCPSAYKKDSDYYIFIPENSYYHNKLGYFGEKLYGQEKSKVKYIYQMNFPECELPTILTDNEGGKYSQTCPFIIDQNNPCSMVGCGGVDWDKEYVEDLELNEKCKNSVSYYCRINYDLDPKCVAWKPENKYDPKSINVRNYFEQPDEYCDIRNYSIESHPDFKNYIKKDKIPCWGCKVE